MPQLSRIRSFKVFQSTRCSRRQPLKELLFHQTHVELNARLAAELRLSKIPCVCVDGPGGRGRGTAVVLLLKLMTRDFDFWRLKNQLSKEQCWRSRSWVVDVPGRGSLRSASQSNNLLCAKRSSSSVWTHKPGDDVRMEWTTFLWFMVEKYNRSALTRWHRWTEHVFHISEESWISIWLSSKTSEVADRLRPLKRVVHSRALTERLTSETSQRWRIKKKKKKDQRNVQVNKSRAIPRQQKTKRATNATTNAFKKCTKQCKRSHPQNFF